VWFAFNLALFCTLRTKINGYKFKLKWNVSTACIIRHCPTIYSYWSLPVSKPLSTTIELQVPALIWGSYSGFTEDINRLRSNFVSTNKDLPKFCENPVHFSGSFYSVSLLNLRVKRLSETSASIYRSTRSNIFTSSHTSELSR